MSVGASIDGPWLRISDGASWRRNSSAMIVALRASGACSLPP
jgi:hypothetical protein